MASLNAKKTIRNLLSKGFIRSNGDHVYLEFWYKGRYVLQTFCSHNSQDLNDHLINMMKNQCRLSKPDFLDLANCPLSREGYVNKLVEVGLIKTGELETSSSNDRSHTGHGMN